MKHSRTRGAKKVPNVKLRPVETSSWPSSKGQSVPRVELRDDDTIQGEVDICSGNKPFKGIVLCATGALDKRRLFARAQELGAIRTNDFTDRVTHLVADGPGSPKYRCAVELRLPILKESWVDEAYGTWLNGETVDLEQTIIDHRLPIFSGVRLCLTGMDDLDMRTRIHALLAKEDGIYLKSLDKTVTHLLTCTSGDSPKLKWASDYNKSRLGPNKIHLIWEEWFWDSLESGGRWDEDGYNIVNPRPLRKSLSEIPEFTGHGSCPNTFPTAMVAQRTPLPSSVPTSLLLAEETPEFGGMDKVPHARQIFYNSIFQQRIREKEHTKDTGITAAHHVSHTPLEPTMQRGGGTQHQSKADEASAGHNADSDSFLKRIANRRVASFTSTSQSQPRQPFRRIASSNSNAARDQRGSSLSVASTSTADAVSHLFLGYSFRAFGEAKGVNLRDTLISHGGRWLADDEDEEADFIIVRLVSGALYWAQEADDTERAKYRTECWIERCIFEERICPADEHVAFTPLKIDTPVAGSEKLHLSLSGLDTAEACWIKRLIRAIGGNLATNFSRCSTHLICPCGRGAKFDKAREWGVDVVRTEWLVAIATTGEIPAAKFFSVHPAVEKGYAMNVIMEDVNGKTKVNEIGSNDEMTVDITNGISQEPQPSKRQSSSLTLPDTSPSNHIKVASPGTRSLHGSVNPDSEFAFGRPVGLLSAPSSALQTKDMGSGLPLVPPSIITSPSSPLVSRASSTTGEQTNQRSSAAEVEQDRRMTLIPSSYSPSPLEIPSKSGSALSPPITEIRGLKTVITALLGKRDGETRETTDGPAQKRQGRVGKRPRPPSRSKSDLDPRHGTSPALSLLSVSPSFSRLPLDEDTDAVPEEGQASLRVIYEDPGQRAEKRKLIALFEGGATADLSGIGGKDRENDITPIEAVDARPTAKRKSARKSMMTSGE